MSELKTFNDCLEAVKPEWWVKGDRVLCMPIRFQSDQVPTKRQAQQIINLKKMMVIAEAVGVVETFIWLVLEAVSCGLNVAIRSYPDAVKHFIRICQDPDGDGDESKNLFEPFKPEAK